MNSQLSTPVPARVAAPAAPASGPVEIDPSLLRHIAGGLPRGGWSAVDGEAAAQLPRGGWES